MPIEIFELVIKATIQQEKEGSNAPSSGGGNSNNKEQIIKECVEQVLQLLKEKEER